jgi:predicted transcriptional regulator
MASHDSDALDTTFRALGDETRRRIWTTLGDRPGASTADLTSSFPLLSRWAVMKHIGVLRDAGLIQTMPDGRARRHYRVDVGLDEVRVWLDQRG